LLQIFIVGSWMNFERLRRFIMGTKRLEAEVRRLSVDMSFEGLLQKFYSKVIKPGDVVIDIGAHTGRHTLPFSYFVGAHGRVVAIEANPEAIRNLESQVCKFNIQNTEIFSLALSNEEKDLVDFYIAVNAPEESGLIPRKIFSEKDIELRRERVQATTLDKLDVGGNISFIKIDVEGAEFSVLQGAQETILSSRPIIAFEFGENSYDSYDVDPDEVYRYLEIIEYSVFSIHGELLDMGSFSKSSRIQQIWDYIACPKIVTHKIQSFLIG